MDKATSRMRISLMVGLMGVGVVGSIMAVILGKRERAAVIEEAQKKNEERYARARQEQEARGKPSDS